MEHVSRKGKNGAYLIFLCAMAFFVVGRKTGFSLFGILYPYLGTLGLPGMVLLLGREARDWLTDRRKAVRGGVGLLVAGYLLKVLVYWIQTLLGKAPAFYPFSTSGVAWPFLVAGVYLILAGVWNLARQSTRRLMTGTVLLGLVAGLIRPLDSFLCLSQMCVYAPFFVLGARLDLERVEAWCAGAWKKVLSLVLLLGGLGGCVLLRGPLKSLWPLVDGDTWYGGCGGLETRLLLGPFVRLGWYAAALVLVLALFCLTPNLRLPLVTRRGAWAVSGYYFAVALAYGTMAPLSGGMSLGRLALAAALLAAVLLAFPSGWSDGIYRKVTGWVEDNWLDRPAPALTRGSVWERHGWALLATGLFTLFFVVAAVGYVYPFLSNGKSLIWDTDGMGQQFPMMFYCKDYLLQGIRSFLETGAFSFPQWDFTLGFGMSPLDALRREPFMLLALLGDENTMEAVVDVSTVLRLYVCGLAFLWLCRTLGRAKPVPAAMGALVYVFCGFSLFASVRQPYFVTVLMTYEVLMLVGAERYIQKKKYGVFVLAVFLQLFGGYYSAFINGLVLALYLLVRLGCLYGTQWKKTMATIFQLVGFYAWGAGLAMVNLLPSILSLFGSSREQGEQVLDLFYSNGYYRKMLTGLSMEFGGPGYWTYVSLAAIGWIGCILLFLRRKQEQRPYRIGLIACMALLSFPVVGLVANGFAYVCNRWSFAVPLLVALILAEVAPDLLTLTRREKGWILILVLSYAAVVATRPEGIGQVKILGLLVLVMTTLIVLFQDQFLPGRRLRMGVLAVVTVLSVTLACAASYLPEFGNYVDGFQERQEAYQKLSGKTALALEQISSDESFYRVARPSSAVNRSMALDYYGVSAYYSVIPASISDYLADIGMADQRQVFRIAGLNERTVPTALASVKYFIQENAQKPPYGFEPIWTSEEEGVTLYENRYALPLGYTYDCYVTQEEYEVLSLLDRQQVMLESAVLGQETDLLARGQWEALEQRPCEISKVTGMEQEGMNFSTNSNGKIQFTFSTEENCESYLVFEGLRQTDPEANGELRITCTGQEKEQTASVWGQGSSYYFPRDGVAFCLGYSQEVQTTCTLTFNGSKEITWDACYVVSVPMEDYGDQIAQRTSAVLEDVVEEGDRITGTLDLTENRLLALSIPYAKGWKAYVNGQEAELLQVNVMYCGLLLEPGHYEIELRYETPGQKVGTALSLFALGAVVVTAEISWWRKKQLSKMGK